METWGSFISATKRLLRSFLKRSKEDAIEAGEAGKEAHEGIERRIGRS